MITDSQHTSSLSDSGASKEYTGVSGRVQSQEAVRRKKESNNYSSSQGPVVLGGDHSDALDCRNSNQYSI